MDHFWFLKFYEIFCFSKDNKDEKFREVGKTDKSVEEKEEKVDKEKEKEEVKHEEKHEDKEKSSAEAKHNSGSSFNTAPIFALGLTILGFLIQF